MRDAVTCTDAFWLSLNGIVSTPSARYPPQQSPRSLRSREWARSIQYSPSEYPAFGPANFGCAGGHGGVLGVSIVWLTRFGGRAPARAGVAPPRLLLGRAGADGPYVYQQMVTSPKSQQIAISGGGSGEPLQRWLEGLLPDDDAVLRSLSERHDVDLAHRVQLLGTEMGADCAGAVQFCLPARTGALLERRGGCDPIDDDEVFDWLARLREDPAYRPRAHEATASFSLAGMQPKIALRRTGAGWAVPWGAEPSSHIIKVTRPGPYPHEALMEHITLSTAARMGITAARTAVISNDGVEAIVVQRYDRAPTPEGGPGPRPSRGSLPGARMQPRHQVRVPGRPHAGVHSGAAALGGHPGQHTDGGAVPGHAGVPVVDRRHRRALQELRAVAERQSETRRAAL